VKAARHIPGYLPRLADQGLQTGKGLAEKAFAES
jgi:hypothetical protein